jgi:hypothetical protein
MADFSDTHELYGWNGSAQFYQTWAQHKTQLQNELTFTQVRSDWNESDVNSPAYIVNKPPTITQAQADAITANTAKRSYPEADETKLAGVEAGATADQNAAEVPVDTTNFNNNLSPSDSTVQAALETIDEFVLGGSGGGIPILPNDPSSPATGDAWVNETDGLLKFKSATGTIVFEATQFIAD